MWVIERLAGRLRFNDTQQQDRGALSAQLGQGATRRGRGRRHERRRAREIKRGAPQLACRKGCAESVITERLRGITGRVQRLTGIRKGMGAVSAFATSTAGVIMESLPYSLLRLLSFAYDFAQASESLSVFDSQIVPDSSVSTVDCRASQSNHLLRARNIDNHLSAAFLVNLNAKQSRLMRSSPIVTPP